MSISAFSKVAWAIYYAFRSAKSHKNNNPVGA